MPTRGELISLLTAYRPADPAEEEYRLAMADLAAVAADPFDRHDYHLGHFTASAFVLHPDGAKVLLVHHAKLGIWVQPGGHVDPDDTTLLAAAAREVTEETGVTGLRPVTEGLVDIDIHAFTGHGEQPRHLHHDLRFAFVAADPTLTPSDEVVEAVWAGVADLSGFGVDESVLRPVRKLAEGQ